MVCSGWLQLSYFKSMQFNRINDRLPIIITIIAMVMGLVFFTVVLPSVFGLLITIGIVVGCYRGSRMRRHADAIALNSAMRSVSDRDGSVEALLTASAHGGSLAVESFQFVKRLEHGQDVVDAASRSGMPLEVSTAIALRHKAAPDHYEAENAGKDRPLLAIAEQSVHRSSVQAKYAYLLITLAVCCGLGVLIFSRLQYLDNSESGIADSFGRDSDFVWRIDFLWIPALGLLLWFLSLWIEKLLRVIGWRKRPSVRQAHAVAEILLGLSAAIRRGVPVHEALAIAGRVTTNRHSHQSIGQVMQRLKGGARPADAFAAVGWIDAEQQSRLSEGSARRAAELLERFAVECVQDAMYRLRWWTAFLHPVVLCLAGVFVAFTAIWVFGYLAQIIHWSSQP